MNNALVNIWGSGEYSVPFRGYADIGAFVAIDSYGFFHKATSNTVGVVIANGVPWGCLDIFDEVIV